MQRDRRLDDALRATGLLHEKRKELECVFKPRGIPHRFWNAGPEPARLLVVIWPAGFENFFAERGELAASCPPEEFPERRAALAREYDHHFVHPEWVPELQSKHGLKMLGDD